MFRSIIFSLITVLLLVNSLNAQERKSPEERLKILKAKLNLTEEQTVQIGKIVAKSKDEMKKLRDEGSADKTKAKSILQEADKEIEKILDEKQKVEYKK